MVTRQRSLGPELDWLEDDTEESLAGTSSHQFTIVNLDNDLVTYRDEAGLPWFIGNQLKLVIPRGGARPPYYPSPDIVVHPTLGDIALSSLPFTGLGPVAIAFEIASPATAFRFDLNAIDPQAKPLAYAQGGIPEYLAFDATGHIIPERVRAWRGDGSAHARWLADPATGRWHRALGVSFAPGPQGLLLRLYRPDGTLVPTHRELHALARLQAQEIYAQIRQRLSQAEQLDAQEQRSAALEAELRRLRGEE